MELPIFDLATIANATHNFSNNNKLGEGGFGPVYKVNNNIIRRAILFIFQTIPNLSFFRVYCLMGEI
jgi:hypothetical protein